MKRKLFFITMTTILLALMFAISAIADPINPSLDEVRTGAEQGKAIAQYDLGVLYYSGQGVTQDYAEATKWFRKAADQGLAAAQHNLGLMYINGQGVTQDYGEAAKWFRKAADQGLADSQFNLAQMYRRGEGVSHDDTEAAKWYRKAADQSFPNAQHNLDLMNSQIDTALARGLFSRELAKELGPVILLVVIMLAWRSRLRRKNR